MKENEIGILALFNLIYDKTIIIDDKKIKFKNSNIYFDFNKKIIMYRIKDRLYNIIESNKIIDLKIIVDTNIINMLNVKITESEINLDEFYKYIYILNQYNINKHKHYNKFIHVIVNENSNKLKIESFNNQYIKEYKIKNISNILTNYILSSLMFPNKQISNNILNSNKYTLNEITKIKDNGYFDLILDSCYLNFL